MLMRPLLGVVSVAVLTAACGVARRPPVVSAPAPPGTTPAPVTASGPARVVETALHLQGTPYRYGGADPRRGFDCSGFVQFVYREAAGLSMPRDVRAQFGVGQRIRRDQIRPGDLVFFATVASGPSHVGIVIDRDRFVHAPNSRGVVRIARLDERYWRTRFLGARRLR